jgi:23S rRNA pseudouridine1911/1915/1917 synthase
LFTMNLKILYEDDQLLVIDKPTGVVVNTSETVTAPTIQEFISPLVQRSQDPDSEFNLRNGIVHRLDKDTSGVLIVAKSEIAFERLQKQFKKRKVLKEYIVLVHGRVKDEVFEINAPIKRNPKNRLKYAVVKDGKEALTQFRKIKELEREEEVLTLLIAMPETGRTHQIRVHLAALGFPVVSDELYSSTKLKQKWNAYYPRMMLHSHRITITHPATGEKVVFESPLPDEFKF